MADNGGIIIDVPFTSNVSTYALSDYDDDVLPDRLAPTIIMSNIRTENISEYLLPEPGHIVFKIIKKPKGSFIPSDSGLYRLDAIRNIINSKTGINPAMYTPNLAQLYRPFISANILQFMAHTRVFGITSVKDLSDREKQIPSVNTPVVIEGRLNIDSPNSRENALKIPSGLFVSGEDSVEWQNHVRLEVFLILLPDFTFFILLTKCYDIENWFKSEKGRQFVDDDINYGYVHLGYHFDNTPHKSVFDVAINGDRYLQKFIFQQGNWYYYAKYKENIRCTFSISEFEADFKHILIPLVTEILRDEESDDIRAGIIPWFAKYPEKWMAKLEG